MRPPAGPRTAPGRSPHPWVPRRRPGHARGDRPSRRPTHAEGGDGGDDDGEKAPSIFGNYVRGLQWLAEGKIRTDGLAEARNPDNPQPVYDDLQAGNCPALTYWFNWQG